MRVEYAFAVFATLMTLAAATGGARPSGGYFLEALPYYLSGCRSEYFDECLSRTIDGILEKNETYRLNGYLTVKFDKTESGNNVRQVADNGDVVGVRAYGLATRILRFFHALRVRYQPEDDDRPAVLNFEGRKKKYKGGDKHNKMGMMLGATSMAMTVVNGMMMKMMMGGVSMIATKALLIAKLALILVSIMALKKIIGGGGGIMMQPPSYGGSSGGVVEHPGYSRTYNVQPNSTPGTNEGASAMAYRDQLNGLRDDDNDDRPWQYTQHRL